MRFVNQGAQVNRRRAAKPAAGRSIGAQPLGCRNVLSMTRYQNTPRHTLLLLWPLQPKGCAPILRLGLLLQACIILSGCATPQESSPALRQQAEADFVVSFQSWKAISFLKPDLAGTAGTLTVRRKTFTRAAVEKLLHDSKRPKQFIVVILDRQYNPDPLAAGGGIDAIRKFFQGLGFRRVVFQDGDGTILRDAR